MMMTRSTTPTNPLVCLACCMCVQHTWFRLAGRVAPRVLRVHGCGCETVCSECYVCIGGWLEGFSCLHCDMLCPPPFLCRPRCDAELHKYWGFPVGAVAGFGVQVIPGENGFRFAAAAHEEDGSSGEGSGETSGDSEEDES